MRGQKKLGTAGPTSTQEQKQEEEAAVLYSSREQCGDGKRPVGGVHAMMQARVIVFGTSYQVLAL